MAYRYECINCDFHTAFMPRAAAEAARHGHHDLAHCGRAPRNERFTSSGERVADNPRQLLFVLAMAVIATAVWGIDAIL